MSLITRLALNAIGRLGPRPASGDAAPRIRLPRPDRHGGVPLMQALVARRSTREFAATPLSRAELGAVLWAADGVNRPREGERTAPSAMNSQEIDLYAALADGLYRYEPATHSLVLIAAEDFRPATGLQDLVDAAPLDLVFVADLARMKLVPEPDRLTYAAASAGAMAQNVYLVCASLGLACVVRGWFDAKRLAGAMALSDTQRPLLAQTVGHCQAG